MEIKVIESFLYNSSSTTEEIISFLNFIYTANEDEVILSDDFFNAFKKAYKKENILTILNRKIEEVANDREEIDNKDVEITDITEIIGLTKIENFQKLIYKVIIDGTEAIKNAHELYLNQLRRKEQPIKYIIIGEAPPFSFIKNPDKSELDELELIFENNYILSKKNAGSWQSSIRGAFGITAEKKDNAPVNFIEGLVFRNILFFDIIPVTLPFSTDIRTAWINQEKNIDKKPLLVFLLELAIKRNVKGLKIDPNVKVAFVTPPKTSISIFDYYSDEKLKIKDKISVDITIINDNTTKSKYGVSPDIILPMYKANAMMGSNTPSVDLIKLALDL